MVSNTSTRRRSSHELLQARSDLEVLFKDHELEALETDLASEEAPVIEGEMGGLIQQAHHLLSTLESEQVEALQDLLMRIQEAVRLDQEVALVQLRIELEDFLYYTSTRSE